MRLLLGHCLAHLAESSVRASHSHRHLAPSEGPTLPNTVSGRSPLLSGPLGKPWRRFADRWGRNSYVNI